MPTLYMTLGIPGSGKSFWSKAKQKECGYGNLRRVNKDDLRAMLDDSHHSRQCEDFILEVRDMIVSKSLQQGKSIIVDDTNFGKKHEPRLRQLAREKHADFEIVDFTHVSVEECIERDLKRARSVGEKVIRGMYNEFVRKSATPNDDPSLPPCIIVDIDGTVAQMNGRSPYDWHKVDEDKCREIVWAAVLGLQAQTKAEIIFVSGRDEICRAGTLGWLAVNLNSAHRKLFMRPKDDMRKDYIVKREIYEANIKDKYRVVAVMDDRPQVIELWRDIGFTDRIFNVGTGEEF